MATPTFDWSPPSTAAPASAGINVGVVAGTYTKDDPTLKQFPFDRFASNMGSDFVELLTARGFTTTGPFQSLNEMTYGDKKGCDLVIVPELDVAPANGVDALCVYEGQLYAGGSFDRGVLSFLNDLALWTSTAWERAGVDQIITALVVHEGALSRLQLRLCGPLTHQPRWENPDYQGAVLSVFAVNSDSTLRITACPVPI